MSDKPRIRTRLVFAASLAAFAASFALGACFDGFEAVGLPCTDDAQCGPKDGCFDGYCAGLFACSDGDLASADELCDGQQDCPDGSDEDYELCFGDAEPFACGDGTQVPHMLTCDGTADCLDAADEDPISCAGVGVNQCEAPDGDLGYSLGPAHPTAPNFPVLAVADFLGTDADDVVVAGIGSKEVKLVFFDEAGKGQDFFVNGPPPSFGASEVADIELGPANASDAQLDLVIATNAGEIHVFKNNRPMPPTPYGEVSVVPGLLNADIVGIELGNFNADETSDIAVITGGALTGRVFFAVGDPAAAEMGGAYFTFNQQASFLLNYTTFLDSDMVDVDGDGDDDLVVSSVVGNVGVLWVIKRSGANTQGPIEWDMPTQTMLPFPGSAVAFGRFSPSMSSGPDLVVLDALSGRMQTMANQDGMFMPRQQLTLPGAQISGLMLADMNCDDRDDLLFNVGNPAQVRVLLGDGIGGVLSEDAVIYESEGVPRGGLAVTRYDADSSLDIVSAVDVGEGAPTAQIRLLLTSEG